MSQNDFWEIHSLSYIGDCFYSVLQNWNLYTDNFLEPVSQRQTPLTTHTSTVGDLM